MIWAASRVRRKGGRWERSSTQCSKAHTWTLHLAIIHIIHIHSLTPRFKLLLNLTYLTISGKAGFKIWGVIIVLPSFCTSVASVRGSPPPWKAKRSGNNWFLFFGFASLRCISAAGSRVSFQYRLSIIDYHPSTSTSIHHITSHHIIS